MSKVDVQEFDNDEEGYLRWIAQHPYGFVMNTTRAMNPKVMVLHRSSYPSIGEYTKMAWSGGFTERDYIKICAAEMNDFTSWVRRHVRADDSFSSEYSICTPLEELDIFYDWW